MEDYHSHSVLESRYLLKIYLTKMKFFVVAFAVLAVVVADVSHLPESQYLPPQHHHHEPSQDYLPPQQHHAQAPVHHHAPAPVHHHEAPISEYLPPNHGGGSFQGHAGGHAGGHIGGHSGGHAESQFQGPSPDDIALPEYDDEELEEFIPSGGHAHHEEHHEHHQEHHHEAAPAHSFGDDGYKYRNPARFFSRFF